MRCPSLTFRSAPHRRASHRTHAVLALDNYAWCPSMSIKSTTDKSVVWGDFHAYTGTVTTNGARYEDLWLTLGSFMPVLTHGVNGKGPQRPAQMTATGKSIIVLGYRFKAKKGTKSKDPSFGFMQARDLTPPSLPLTRVCRPPRAPPGTRPPLHPSLRRGPRATRTARR